MGMTLLGFLGSQDCSQIKAERVGTESQGCFKICGQTEIYRPTSGAQMNVSSGRSPSGQFS